jgi:hypothetical protein
LKYSQLIQILPINPGKPALMRFAAVIAARINRVGRVRNGGITAAGGAEAAFAAPKATPSGVPRFTRR